MIELVKDIQAEKKITESADKVLDDVKNRGRTLLV